MTFVRVFNQFPGNEVIGNIESIDIIDAPPPSLPLGLPTGTVVCVGEFERGDLNQPVEIFSANDQLQKLGGLGFSTTFSLYDGAVARRSGGNEDWNGNGFIWLRNKRWRRLICVRVDNSAGSVQFSRLACLSGGVGPFEASNADAITYELNGTTPATATMAGAKATLLGVSGTFTGLDTLTLEAQVDAETSLVTTFTAADITLADVIARINATHAQTIAFDVSSELELRSIILGADAHIEIVGGSAAVTLGFPVVVDQLDTYTMVNAQIGSYTLRTTLNVGGVSTDFDAIFASPGVDNTVLRDGLLAAAQNLAVPGVTFADSGAVDLTATGDDNVIFTSTVFDEVSGGDITIANTAVGIVRSEDGTGNVGNLAQFTALEMAAIVDAVANLSASVTSAGNLRVCNSLTPATGTLQATTDVGGLIVELGFNTTDIADANDGTDVTVPAGTRVQGTSPATVWVTLEDVETGSTGGPFDAKVRPFEDTSTALANTSSTITTIVDELPDGFSVTNSASVTRLSGAQLDTQYLTALESTLDLNTPATDSDFITSARSSDTINRGLLTNALAATAGGLSPRKCFVRPLIGTSITDASGSTGQGVGVQRNDRRQYCFPGVVTSIPEIATVGARGGIGFSVTGNVQVGSDSFIASARSILPPEENAGQALFDTNVGPLNILALENLYNPEQGGNGLVLTNYIQFRADGITAPIIDLIDGPQFQSDVTSVDPATSPQLADASRRVMSDFIIKTLAAISKPYVKKLNTPKRRQALTQQYNVFLNSLLSASNPDTQRIAAFSVRDDSTDEQRRTGIQAFNVLVQTLPAILTVLLRIEVGTTVQVEEA